MGQSVDEGASTMVHLATHPDGAGPSGPILRQERPAVVPKGMRETPTWRAPSGTPVPRSSSWARVEAAPEPPSWLRGRPVGVLGVLCRVHRGRRALVPP